MFLMFRLYSAFVAQTSLPLPLYQILELADELEATRGVSLAQKLDLKNRCDSEVG